MVKSIAEDLGLVPNITWWLSLILVAAKQCTFISVSIRNMYVQAKHIQIARHSGGGGRHNSVPVQLELHSETLSPTTITKKMSPEVAL